MTHEELHDLTDVLSSQISDCLEERLMELKARYNLPMEEFVFVGGMSLSVCLAGFTIGSAAAMGLDIGETQEEVISKITSAAQLPFRHAMRHKYQ